MADQFVGEIRLLPFMFVPEGWASCNGAQLPVSQNQVLYAVIGNQFGGNTTYFTLPNLQGSAPMGAGNGNGLTPRTLGQSGGAAGVTLLPTQMPTHQHDCTGNGFPGASDTPDNTLLFGGEPDPKFYLYKENPTNQNLVPMSPQALQNSGGNQANANQQPWLAVQFCIALDGAFPVRP